MRILAASVVIALTSAPAFAAVCNFNNTEPFISGSASGNIFDAVPFDLGPGQQLAAQSCPITGPWTGLVTFGVTLFEDDLLQRVAVDINLRHVEAPDAHSGPGDTFSYGIVLNFPVLTSINDLAGEVTNQYGGVTTFTDADTITINTSTTSSEDHETHKDRYSAAIEFSVFGRDGTGRLAAPVINVWSVQLSGFHDPVPQVPLPASGLLFGFALATSGLAFRRRVFRQA